MELLEVPEAEDDEGLWEEHAPALSAFLVVSGQWRTRPTGMGGSRWIGLDYGAARAGFDLAGLTVSPAVWADVREIEAGALDELNREH